ncbi:MAG: glycosyl hydrolase 115 family protein [Pyrinomonadaceae bacterium]
MNLLFRIAGSNICSELVRVGFALLAISLSLSAQAVKSYSKYGPGDFPLVYQNRAADVLVSPEDFRVVQIAAGDLAADVERVTGKRPTVVNGASATRNVVVIGTLGHSAAVDGLVKSGKINVSRIEGKWESFIITTVRAPSPGIDTALVIAGSDRRGTAFGVYQLSQAIGVSPWYWWADVTPEHKFQLIISPGQTYGGEPSVKYRGIFLNDEDWGLQPWAAKTLEPETGDLGPKTYARIFELLLRLKANIVWPAMHEVTHPFNTNPANRQVADDYGIVLGSSHAEPMLRNNVGEWKRPPDDYNFVTNQVGVTEYWDQRAGENGKFENVYTLGMRGIHDSPIQGTRDQPERIKVLEKIIEVQRQILTKRVDPNVTAIPQIFCPYKEVLADYRSGLKVPDDVTVVFPDDNFGYVRQFPTPAEQKRKGGFGVYYHLSYLGRPLSYLWLNTTPPGLIWEEMSKAYDHNMRQFWVLNVGDLKPGEIGLEFFMQMAWDIKKWRRENLGEYLRGWASREFGAAQAREIAEVMDGYYRLGYARKPEHLQWYLPNESPRPSEFSAVDLGDEMQTRLDAYQGLRNRAEAVFTSLPPEKKDAFYELVLYPVRSASLVNQRFFATEKAVLYARQDRASALSWAIRAKAATVQIEADTKYFNEQLANGKWRFIMSPEMGQGQWPSMRSSPPRVPESVLNRNIPEVAALGVAIEGDEKPVELDRPGRLKQLDVFTKGTRFIDVYNQGRAPVRWNATANRPWIRLSQTKGELKNDTRVVVSIDWRLAPMSGEVQGEVEIKTPTESRRVIVTINNPTSPRPADLKGFVESNGVISIEAENFTAKTERDGSGWQTVFGLGRTGDSVTIFPTTAGSIEPTDLASKSPVLQYQIYSFTGGDFDARCYLLPTQPLAIGRGLRYAIGIDDHPPQMVVVGADVEVSSPLWARNVLNATTIGASQVKLSPGRHVLKIYMVDAGVVVDKIVLQAGASVMSYLGPPETIIRH